MIWRKLWKRAVEVQPALDWPTDARRASGRAGLGQVDPEAARRMRLRTRILAALFFTVFGTGFLATLFGHGGLVERFRLRGELSEMNRKVAEQRARVEALRLEVSELATDSLTRERIAREQLGLARPGEITFIFADEPGAPRGSNRRGEASAPKPSKEANPR